MQVSFEQEPLCEYTLHGRAMNVHLPYSAAGGSAARAASRAMRLAEAVAESGFGIASESIELRRVFDRRFENSSVARFSTSLRAAFGARA